MKINKRELLTEIAAGLCSVPLRNKDREALALSLANRMGRVFSFDKRSFCEWFGISSDELDIMLEE